MLSVPTSVLLHYYIRFYYIRCWEYPPLFYLGRNPEKAVSNFGLKEVSNFRWNEVQLDAERTRLYFTTAEILEFWKFSALPNFIY